MLKNRVHLKLVTFLFGILPIMLYLCSGNSSKQQLTLIKMKKNDCFSQKDLGEMLLKIGGELDAIYYSNGVMLQTALGTNIATARYAVSSAIHFLSQYVESKNK